MQQRLLVILVVVVLVGTFMVSVPDQTTVAIEGSGEGTVSASATCDGDNLLITWSGPDYFYYEVRWGGVAFAASRPNGAVLTVPPSGTEAVWESPHWLIGPGTWLDVVFVGMAPFSPPPSGMPVPLAVTPGPMQVVELGDFTCPDPEPTPDVTPVVPPIVTPVVTPEPEERIPVVYGCARDGRLNYDFCGYPIAVYRIAGGYSIYAIDPTTAEGTLAVEVLTAGSETGLLAEDVHSFTGQPIAVYLLSNGDIQINTFYANGKDYIFVISSRGSHHLAR